RRAGRGCGAHPRRWSVGGLPAGQPAAGGTVARRRCGPVLGSGPRRVRCDHHLRREPPGPNPDHATGRVRDPREQARCRHSHEPGAVGPFRGGARRRGQARAGRPVTLRAEVELRLGSLELSAAVEVSPGLTTVVVGPNGAGKTTLLRALAGLVPLARGRVALDGQVLDDRAADRWVPPDRRRLGVVFQDGLLFGHLSDVDTVAFGLTARGLPPRAA